MQAHLLDVQAHGATPELGVAPNGVQRRPDIRDEGKAATKKQKRCRACSWRGCHSIYEVERS